MCFVSPFCCCVLCLFLYVDKRAGAETSALYFSCGSFTQGENPTAVKESLSACYVIITWWFLFFLSRRPIESLSPPQRPILNVGVSFEEKKRNIKGETEISSAFSHLFRIARVCASIDADATPSSQSAWLVFLFCFFSLLFWQVREDVSRMGGKKNNHFIPSHFWLFLRCSNEVRAFYNKYRKKILSLFAAHGGCDSLLIGATAGNSRENDFL